MSRYESDSDYEQERKPGLSTTMKVLLIVLVFGGGLMLLCCGGGLWFAQQRLQITDQPEEIAAIADSIARIEIPQEYQPRAGVTMRMVFEMKLAAFGRDRTVGQLVLIELVIPGEQSDEEMRRQFRQQARQQGRDREIDVESRETRTFEIDGEEYDFEFVHGTDRESGTEVRQVSGMFRGRGGSAFLLLLEEEEHWDEEQVVRLIESISAR